MQEAAASSNLFFYRDDGSSFQHTIRAPYYPDNPGQADEECMERVIAFINRMKEKGWHLKRQNGSNGTQPATATQPAASNGGGENTFTATKLQVKRNDKDEKIGKLKGGKFMKFGVTLWPEMAQEMGWNLEDMTVGDHDIEPINVRYILNDKGDPQKVVGYA